MFILLCTAKEKDIAIDEKIFPVEIIDNFFDPVVGEEINRKKRILNKMTFKQTDKVEDSTRQFLEGLKSTKGKLKLNNKTIENKKKLDKGKTKTTRTQEQSVRKEKIGSGSKAEIINNEPEKYSVLDSRKIKIACLECIRPNYPPIALRRGEEGTPPIVKVWINKNGKVTKAKLITFSGIESIDNAAKKAALSSSFYPLDKESTINIEYDLKIK